MGNEFNKTEGACALYWLILPRLKKLLKKKDYKEDDLEITNIEVVKLRLKNILDNPNYFVIKNILMNTPLWDNELNILANKLQSNV
jgi:hypothetical protein